MPRRPTWYNTLSIAVVALSVVLLPYHSPQERGLNLENSAAYGLPGPALQQCNSLRIEHMQPPNLQGSEKPPSQSAIIFAFYPRLVEFAVREASDVESSFSPCSYFNSVSDFLWAILDEGHSLTQTYLLLGQRIPYHRPWQLFHRRIHL